MLPSIDCIIPIFCYRFIMDLCLRPPPPNRLGTIGMPKDMPIGMAEDMAVGVGEAWG